MKTLFAWDFHGVLEKDNELAVKEICDTLLRKKSINKEITLEKVRELYGLRWYDYFTFLFPQASHKELMETVGEAIAMSGHLTKNFLKANDYAEDVLQKIKNQGHWNIVVSNSCQVRIMDFVSWVKLDHLVSEVIGIDKHQNDSSFDLVKEKAKVVKDQAEKLGAQKIVMVGDREEDILAGLAVGAVTYLYKGLLSRHSGETKARHIVTDLREVLKEL